MRNFGGVVRWTPDAPIPLPLADARTRDIGAATLQQASSTIEDLFAHDGDLAIVGRARLWDTDRLRAAAGGLGATTHADSGSLLLAAYRRQGTDMLDLVEGEFSFAIWNAAHPTLILVRDRFGAIPLFLERVDDGARFASSVAALTETSPRQLEPDRDTITEFLGYRMRSSPRTFVEGIERVPASTVVAISPTSSESDRYWNPTPNDEPTNSAAETVERFRELFVTSVARRTDGAAGVVAQLSGGIDSSSVVAAAARLEASGNLVDPFTTASVYFDDPSIDESRWIDSTTAALPFAHESIVAQDPSPESLAADMAAAGGPMVSRTRDIWHHADTIAADSGASVVLTGNGGDEVLEQDQAMVDIARTTPRHFINPMAQLSVRQPREAAWTLRQLTRQLVRDPALPQPPETGIGDPPTFFEYPTWSQMGIIASTQAPAIAMRFEFLHSVAHTKASAPFLDRELVEFVSSIAPHQRPFDGRSKTLARHSFQDALPPAVLNRRKRTVADTYLTALSKRQLPIYQDRFPAITETAKPFLHDATYQVLLSNPSRITAKTARSLWLTWALMEWLEIFSSHKR